MQNANARTRQVQNDRFTSALCTLHNCQMHNAHNAQMQNAQMPDEQCKCTNMHKYAQMRQRTNAQICTNAQMHKYANGKCTTQTMPNAKCRTPNAQMHKYAQMCQCTNMPNDKCTNARCANAKFAKCACTDAKCMDAQMHKCANQMNNCPLTNAQTRSVHVRTLHSAQVLTVAVVLGSRGYIFHNVPHRGQLSGHQSWAGEMRYESSVLSSASSCHHPP